MSGAIKVFSRILTKVLTALYEPFSFSILLSFSVNIEMLRLLLRLGTFQLSDLFYNTVGGVVGGLACYGIMKARKRL